MKRLPQVKNAIGHISWLLRGNKFKIQYIVKQFHVEAVCPFDF